MSQPMLDGFRLVFFYVLLHPAISQSPPDVSRHPNLSLLPTTCGTYVEDRIPSGISTDIFEFPWMAVINYKFKSGISRFGCGGTIINERYILTAAHCLTKLARNTTIEFVRVGDHDLMTEIDCIPQFNECAPPYQDIKVEKLIPHPGYTRATIFDNIGLIRLATPIESRDNIEAICFPITPILAAAKLENTIGIVSGWDTIKYETSKLLRDLLPILDQQKCERIYNRSTSSMISFRQMCAGGVNGRHWCGAFGIPLQKMQTSETNVVKNTQYGILSFGPSDCRIQLPRVYTRVPYYMDWILDQMQP